jgi:hypothetical protein
MQKINEVQQAASRAWENPDLRGFFHHCKAGIVYHQEKHEKDESVEKEPYNSSTDKAKLLKIEDFGTPDES